MAPFEQNNMIDLHTLKDLPRSPKDNAQALFFSPLKPISYEADYDDYESEFSEEEDDFDYTAPTNHRDKSPVHADLWEDEDEFGEDSEEEEEENEDDLERKLALIRREKANKIAAGLTVLEGKLNWLDFVPEEDFEEIKIGVFPKEKTLLKHLGRDKYKKSNIKIKIVKIGKTRIVFRPTCKHFEQNGFCKFPNCKFYHPKLVSQFSVPPPQFSVPPPQFSVPPPQFSVPPPQFSTPPPQFSTPPPVIGDTQTQCVLGSKCVNTNCDLFHPIKTRKTHSSLCSCEIPSCPRVHEHTNVPPKKKMWLCKHQFKITSDSISVVNECKFGGTCVFLHSKEELAQMVEKCKHGETCKTVALLFKVNEDGKKIRRYENISDGQKCFRLHPKERVVDYIKRTQARE